MSKKLGKRQLEKLLNLSNPSLLQVVPDDVAASLVKRGLLVARSSRSDGFIGITPAGMRAAADAFEAGLFRQFFDPRVHRGEEIETEKKLGAVGRSPRST